MIAERAFMEGTLDAFDFILAADLHRSVAEVRAMPNAEYIEWRAFYVWRRARVEFEAQHAR